MWMELTGEQKNPAWQENFKEGKMTRIIKADRSVVVAADVSGQWEVLKLAKAINGVKGIGGIKLGMTQIKSGVNKAVNHIREVLGSNISIIYDHQKAGNDIPPIGSSFARELRFAGVDAAILFPFAGPATQEAWTKALQDEGLGVLTGGVMTHEKFLVSEGGYIDDGAVLKIYELAVNLDVTNFIVPGTKLDWVKRIRVFLDECIGTGKYDLFAPGFIIQGGIISECGRAAGPRFHAIVGSAIYEKKTREEIHAAACEMTKQVAA